MKRKFLVGLFILAGLGGCRHEPQAPPVLPCAPVSFTSQVRPILETNCTLANCHVAGSPDGNFHDFAALKEKIDNGSFHNSVIDWNAPRMPETYKLSAADLQLLQCWLRQGALPN